MLLSFVMLHMSFVNFILGGSVHQYPMIIEAWKHHPIHYIPSKQFIPKSPK